MRLPSLGRILLRSLSLLLLGLGLRLGLGTGLDYLVGLGLVLLLRLCLLWHFLLVLPLLLPLPPDDSFAVGPGAGDPLGGVLADQEAVARAPHVLAPRGSIPAFKE